MDDYLRMVRACAERDRTEVILRSTRMGFLTGTFPPLLSAPYMCHTCSVVPRLHPVLACTTSSAVCAPACRLLDCQAKMSDGMLIHHSKVYISPLGGRVSRSAEGSNFEKEDGMIGCMEQVMSQQ